MIFSRLKEYCSTTVLPWDFLRPAGKGCRLRLGWCSVFPPSANGAAMVTYTVLKRLISLGDIEISAIPVGGRIDKRMFPGMRVTTLSDRRLDAIVFFCLGERLGDCLRQAAVKTIVWQTAHESIADDPREQELFESVKRSDLVLTMTRGACRDYQRRGLEAQYLPAGVDTEVFYPAAHAGPVRVLCATRVHYYKGVSAYLDAIPLVRRKYPDTHFCLHGPIDPNTNYAREIQGQIAKTARACGGHFSYQSAWIRPDDVPAVFRGSDIFVFPSDNEGFGVPLIEAMSCGMPCVVLDKAPMNEIVLDGVTGSCLPVRKDSMDRYHGYRFPHPEDIAAAVCSYIASPELLRQRGAHARERAQAEYSLDGCVRALIKYIETMTQGKVSSCACS